MGSTPRHLLSRVLREGAAIGVIGIVAGVARGCDQGAAERVGAGSKRARRDDDLRVETDFVLDALEHAICDRCGRKPASLIHHSDRGTQYVSMRYTERLAEAGIAPSVGSRGDSTTIPRRIRAAWRRSS